MQVAQEVIVKKLDLMKNQAALIVRGNKLMLQSQYQGNVARALALNPFLSHFNFVPIYKDDLVEMEIKEDGSYSIKKHVTKFGNIGNDKIIGGYVRAVKKDGSVYMTEVMTMEQIKIAWSKSSNSSLSVHKEFPLKMVRKTILNSLCSWLINTTGEQEEYGEVEYIENEESSIVNGMEINLDETKGFEVLDEEIIEPEYFQTHSYDEPTVAENETVEEYEDEEPTDEEWQMAMEEDAEETISYSKWLNEYKGNGWVQVQGSYDAKAKTVRVRRA
jgi:recombinational DNA repair protein RecT